MKPFIPPVPASAVAGVLARTGPYPLRPAWRSRRRRLLGEPGRSSLHHVMSRTAGGTVWFDDTDKEALLAVLRRMCAFAHVRLLTFCVMGNHFHALVEVPSHDGLAAEFAGPEGGEKLMRHLLGHYREAHVRELRAEVGRLRAAGREEEAQTLLGRYVGRMADVRWWAKEVKERFSRWYNKRHGRKGTLWMERFRSVLVEEGEVARVMAAYIDRNPERAGMVGAAGDYAWNGLGRAARGERAAEAGLGALLGLGEGEWRKRDGLGAYGAWLAATDKGAGGRLGAGKAGVLGRGLAVGGAEWVERVYAAHRGWFPAGRKRGGQRVAALPQGWAALRGTS